VTHDEERHGTTTLHAALNLASAEIVADCLRELTQRQIRRLAVSSVDERTDAIVESVDRRNGLSS
jgi:hypothetical protein